MDLRKYSKSLLLFTLDPNVTALVMSAKQGFSHLFTLWISLEESDPDWWAALGAFNMVRISVLCLHLQETYFHRFLVTPEVFLIKHKVKIKVSKLFLKIAR